MTDSRTVQIDGMGSILLEHSNRIKRTTVTVKPQQGVIVSVPVRESFEEALEFVKHSEPWIRKMLAGIQQLENHQKALAELFSNIDELKAQKTLTTKLQVLAKKHGFTYGNVSIGNQKTQWGNCLHKSTIILDIKLVALPEELMNYVILHELVHTRISSHGMKFWTELDKYVGNGKGKALASKLKEYGGSIL